MDDIAVARLVRVLRIRRGWRQEDLGAVARVSRQCVSRFERGHLWALRLTEIRAVCAALEVRVPFVATWQGGDADRVVNERHGLLQQRLCDVLAARPGWTVDIEVTFSIFGERGAIDLLAWHAESRTVLVVELKTEIVDPAGLVRQVDRYRRLAPRIAREQGWDSTNVGIWVAVLDTTMNRRRLARSLSILRRAFPTDGRSVRPWIDRPIGPLAALSFVANSPVAGTTRDHAPTRRVRRAAVASRSTR